MTRKQTFKKIEQRLRLSMPWQMLRIMSIEDFSGGFVVKYYREYNDAREYRVSYYYVPLNWPNEVHSKWDMIA